MQLTKEWYNSARAKLSTIYSDNCFATFDFSPTELIELRQCLVRINVRPQKVVIADNVWVHLRTHVMWSQVFAPEYSHEETQKGRLGASFGLDFFSDGHLPSDKRFLKDGEIIMWGDYAGVDYLSYMRLLKQTDKSVLSPLPLEW